MCIAIDQAANDCDLEPVAYEFFTQAYILYEEEISVSSILCAHVNCFLYHKACLFISSYA